MSMLRISNKKDAMEPVLFEKIIVKKLMNNPNKSTILLCIDDESELYSRFSVLNGGNYPPNSTARINEEIVEYLISEVKKIPHKNSAKIRINVTSKVESNIEHIEKLIQDNIREKMATANETIKRTNRNAFALAGTGMLLIALTQLSHFLISKYSLNEFIIVMSWVFMWKAVELFSFKRVEILRAKTNLAKIFYSEISMEKITGR